MFKCDRGVSLIKKLPLDRILTETDGPFVEIDGKPIAAGDVSEVVRLIAGAVGCEVHDMRRTIVNNFATLVSPL
jgi:TatD DNase family protein